MKETIKSLIEEREELVSRISSIDSAVSALRKVCGHVDKDGSSSMEHTGNDSHKTYYECTNCGFKEWE